MLFIWLEWTCSAVLLSGIAAMWALSIASRLGCGRLTFGLYIHNGGHASLPSGTYPHAGCCWRIRQAHWTVSRIQAMCGLHRGLVRCGSRVDVTDVGVDCTSEMDD